MPAINLLDEDKLKQRSLSAQDKIKQFDKACRDFVLVWNKIIAEENGLEKDLKKIVDKTKILHVLKNINNFKQH